MGDEASLSKCLSGVNRLFIVSPGAENRAELTIKTAKYAELAGVKRVLVLSVSTAGLKSAVFGRQFGEIEASIKKLKVSWTIIRLPLFMENYFLHVTSIINQSTIRMPFGPGKPYTPVAVSDAGNHQSLIYCLVCQ